MATPQRSNGKPSQSEPSQARPAALERAVARLASGPINAWDSPSRYGAAGVAARRALERAIRPYAVRQRETDAALLDAVRGASEEVAARIDGIERRIRALALANPLDPEGVIDVETQIGPMWLNLADRLVTPIIAEHKAYEVHVTALMNRTLRPGMTVVDVGANIGWFSVLASRLVGESGFVVAVEPGSNNLPLLRANLWRNRCHNALVLPVAAYAHTGHVQMMMNPEGGAGNWIQPGLEDAVLVPCARLDELLDGRRVDVLKTDAEGSDDQAIRGLQETIARSPDITIISEWWTAAYGGHGSRPADVLRFYESLGMRIWLLLDNGDEQPTTPHALLGLASSVPFVNIVMRKAP
jgi:FkbM family methyltransferase